MKKLNVKTITYNNLQNINVRLEMYETALKSYKNKDDILTGWGLCHYLCNAFEIKINEAESDYFFSRNMKDLLLELGLFSPKDDYGFWFEVGKKPPRRAILRKAISLTKKTIKLNERSTNII